MTKRILVLGSDDFVGNRVTQLLGESGWALPVADGDVAAADGIVNCFTGSPAATVAQAQSLLAAALRRPMPPPIVHISSMAVYGAQSGLMHETAPLQGTDAYSQGKIAVEQLLQTYPRVSIIRPGVDYGPGGGPWTARIARLLWAHRLGDLGVAGDGCCNLAFVNDVAKAVVSALQLPESQHQVFNVSAPQPPTWNEYFVSFARALGAVPVSRIGGRRLKIETKLLAPPLKIAEMLFKRAGAGGIAVPDALSPSLLRVAGQNIRLDVTAATHILKVDWTPIDHGLAQAANWMNGAGGSRR